MKKYFVIKDSGIYYVLESVNFPELYDSAEFVSDSWRECDEYATESSPIDMLFIPGFEI